MRPLVLLIPYLLAAAVAAAETAGPESAGDAAAVAALFAAERPASTAWAAYHAARLGLRGEAPRLVAGVLKPTAPKSAERAAAQACAAALADLRQPVAAEVPPALWGHGARAEAMLLVALEPARHQAWLLERLADTVIDDGSWLMAIQLLAQTRSVAAVEAILRGTAPQLTVLVRDADDERIHEDTVDFRCSDGVTWRLDGFPPVVRWSLTTQTQDGGPLLDGPFPVWAVRQEQLDARKGAGSSGTKHDRNEVRATILAGFVPDAAPEVQARPVRDLAWTGEAAFIQACSALLAGEQRRWQALTEALQRAGLVPAGTQAPQVGLQLTDRRREAARMELPGIVH